MTTNTPEPDDEVMRRALEIHRRLMREQGLDFYNTDHGPAHAQRPAPAPAEGEARQTRRG
jgi:hypothetical protein